MNWARDQGIIVGPGRGSMVGVLVSYLLGITEIDPVKYHLLFERAINPARPTIPDFDIDFENDRIEEVIDYVREKYGQENVVLIGTHLHMAPRMTLKKILRSLGVPFQKANRITSEMPDNTEITNNKRDNEIDFLIEGDAGKDLKELLDGNDIIRPAANAMLGLLSSYGQHAAGVIISDPDRNIIEEVPMMWISSSRKRVSQYDMETLKKMHLVKFDFLRLSTLKAIAQTIEYIGHDPFRKLDDFEDEGVFRMMSDGHLATVFQYQGGAARQCIMEMGVNSFEDMVAVNALARPGAINFLQQYVEGKRAPNDVEYACNEIIPILGYTYGVILYQEQVMEIVKSIAGWDDLGADKIKEAIKSKASSEFDEMHPDFLAGCAANGIEKAAAERIWKNIDDYRSYGFNRAHSVAYSAIGFQTAYLKRYYPKEWITAVLNTTPEKSMNEAIDEARRMDIALLPPNINRSQAFFSYSPKGVRCGLRQIKGIGEKVAKDIIGEREQGGRFVSIEDFRTRMSKYKSINTMRLGILEQGGALATVGGDSCDPDVEMEMLGTYVSHHPLNGIRDRLGRFVYEKENVRALHANADGHVNWGGIVTAIKAITTRKGQPMAFVKLSYFGDAYDFTFFPNVWMQASKFLKVGDAMILRAKKEAKRNSFVVNEYKLIDTR